MNRDEKVKKVADLHERLSVSDLVVLTDFTGLDVGEMTELRAKLKEAGATYLVTKNTMLRLAAKDTSAESLAEHFVGPNGVTLAQGDVVSAAKVLHEFAKESKKFEIKVGVLEGNSIAPQDIKALADLPSREVLLAQMLGAMNAVPGGFVGVLAAVPRNFVQVLKAIEDKKAAE